MRGLGLLAAVGACSGTSMQPVDAPGTGSDIAGFDVACSAPRAAWDGTGLWVACFEFSDKTIRVVEVDKSGNRLASGITLGAAVDPFTRPSVAWTGAHLAVAWDQVVDASMAASTGVAFATVAPDGTASTPQRASTVTDTSALHPDLAWNGSELGLVFSILSGTYFARLDPAGNVVTPEAKVTPGYRSASLAWTGSEWGLAWSTSTVVSGQVQYSIAFDHLDAGGTKIGSDVEVSTSTLTSAGQPALCWTGSSYAVVWADGRNAPSTDQFYTDIFFAQLDATGNRIGPEVALTAGPGAASNPSIVCAGSEVGVAWEVNRDGSNVGIVFVRVDATGARVAADVVATQIGQPVSASLVWTGDAYALAWEATRSSRTQVFVRFL